MKTDIKQRWVEALESGKFTQGREALRRMTDEGFKHCCLGVLCDLAVEDGVVTAEQPILGINTEYRSTSNPDDVTTGTLPRAVQRWAGLDVDIPEVFARSGLSRGLASLNDGGMEFPEIARLIKEQL